MRMVEVEGNKGVSYIGWLRKERIESERERVTRMGLWGWVKRCVAV